MAIEQYRVFLQGGSAHNRLFFMDFGRIRDKSEENLFIKRSEKA